MNKPYQLFKQNGSMSGGLKFLAIMPLLLYQILLDIIFVAFTYKFFDKRAARKDIEQRDGESTKTIDSIRSVRLVAA